MPAASDLVVTVSEVLRDELVAHGVGRSESSGIPTVSIRPRSIRSDSRQSIGKSYWPDTIFPPRIK